MSCTDSCSIDYEDCLDVCSGLGADYSSACISQQCVPNYNSCVSSCSSSTNSSNIIQSVNGATVTLNDEALATGVGEPMFFWYGQLLNVAITFTPVIVVVSMFWLIYGYLKNLGNKNSLDSKKSLDNK